MLLLEDVILPGYHRGKAILSMIIFGSAVFLSGLEIYPAPLLFLGGGTLMVLFRTLRIQEAFQYLSIKILFTIAGMISLAKAMEVMPGGTASHT